MSAILKNLDLQHFILIAFAIACAIVIALLPKTAPFLGALEAALVGAAIVKTSPIDAAKNAASDVVDAAKKGLGILVILGAGALGVTQAACTKEQANAIVHDVTPIGTCVISSLLSGGITDPQVILQQCGGSTFDSIIAVVDDLINGGKLSQEHVTKARLLRSETVRAKAAGK